MAVSLAPEALCSVVELVERRLDGLAQPGFALDAGIDAAGESVKLGEHLSFYKLVRLLYAE